MINHFYFKKKQSLPKCLEVSLKIFKKNYNKINSEGKVSWQYNSNKVLSILSKDFEQAGFRIETNKKNKISLKVKYKNQDKLKTFDVDGLNSKDKIILEVEAGRAYANNQFLKDVFEASVMEEVDYLILAVKNVYTFGKKKKTNSYDYNKIYQWLDILYSSKKITLDLKGILLVGF